jgi:DNA-binding response OmpR family regulator
MNDKKRSIIVIADDDHDICELTKMQLSRHGFQVFVADNGETALELIGVHRPAVALLDIMMPRLSGLEVARRIRSDPAISQTGIVLFSARSVSKVEADLDGLDIDDYIPKPFSPQDLVQRVNDVIRRRKP